MYEMEGFNFGEAASYTIYNVVMALLSGALQFAKLQIFLCLIYRDGVGPARKTEKEDGGQLGEQTDLGRARTDGVPLERVSNTSLEPRFFWLCF